MTSLDESRPGNRAHPASAADAASLQRAGLVQVTSELTHQVKNRLQAMMVHVAVLKERLAGAPAEVRRSLDVLEAEINRADTGINRLARAARPVEIAMQPLDLVALLRDLADSVSEEWQGKAVSISFAAGSTPLSIVGDQELLRRAFTEVLTDAAEAVREGGSVTITTAREPSRAAVVITATPRSAAPSQSPRGDAAGAPAERATVPPLVRRVVEMHGGDIDMASAEGSGMRAAVRLPLEQPRAA